MAFRITMHDLEPSGDTAYHEIVDYIWLHAVLVDPAAHALGPFVTECYRTRAEVAKRFALGCLATVAFVLLSTTSWIVAFDCSPQGLTVLVYLWLAALMFGLMSAEFILIYRRQRRLMCQTRDSLEILR
jgi:hypothetical protein